MHGLEQAAEQRRGLDAEIILVADRGQRPLRVAGQDQPEQAADGAAVRKAEHRAHLLRADRAGAVRDRLIEDREAVAGRAFGRARDQRQRFRLDLDPLLPRDMGEMGGEQVGRDAPEVEALAAGENGDRHLADLGGGEQELDVRRRLLERFQERVEGVLGEHVDFVDDVDLVARRNRRIAHRLDDLAHVVDAGMGGGIHLDHVDMAPLGDRAARLAGAAGADRRPAAPVRADAVQRLGDQPRGRGLADPAHAGEQERMGQPVALDRIGQRLHHRLLADQLVEPLRTIFAGEDAIGLGGIGHWRQPRTASPVMPARAEGPWSKRRCGPQKCGPCAARPAS